MGREASNPLANFQFEIIGQVPALLKRFSAPDTVFPTQGTSPSPPPSRSSSPKPPGPSTAPPASRKTLLEALAGIEASITPSVISHPVEPTSSSTASRLSGASASAAMPNGKMHSPTPVNNTASTSTTHASKGTSPSAGHIGPASTHPALTTFLPVPSLSISALSSHRPGQTEQTYAQDDAFDVFRNALQRLQAESEEYSRREEETRHAMARQQDQAARWHARADALLEMLTSVFNQCERRVASANYAVSEVERLREVVRRHEEEAAANRSSLARLEAQASELECELAQRRSQIEEDRSLISSCREELNKVTEQAKTEKAHLLADVQNLNGRMRMQATQWAKRERELEAELERQKRDAVLEKERLLAQLREHQDAADMDQQRHAAGLELLEEQLRTALETQRRNRDGLQSRAVGPSAERIDGASPTSAIGLPPRPSASSSVSHKMASEAQISVPSNQLVPAQKSAPYPRRDMEHLPAPHATRELPPRSPATEVPPVKAEHRTPALAQDPAAAKRRPPPAETPTTRRIKPEPSTVGRKPSSAPLSASPVGAQPVFQAPVKPETSTPLIDRHVEANNPPASDTSNVPRREQSLDYEPGPSYFQVKALNNDQPPVVPGKPVGPSATFAPRPQEFNRPHDPFEAAAIAPETPSPAVSFGMSSSELLVGHPSIPDLAYPSRSNSPALIMSTLPSEGHGVGLGIIDSNQSGPLRNAVGPRSRGHTPPRPVPGQPRGGPRRDRIPVHVAREVDHWSPTPGRPPLYREPYSPPGRLKRPRDEDESPERSPLRARISPPFDGSTRPLQPLPRHSPGARSRSRSPYYNPRGRSPSPRRSPPWDRAYNGPRDDYSPVRPRSFSRSRSRTRSPTPPPPPIQGASNGAPADGYAPPPQANRQESDVRFPQVVAAPVPEPAPGSLRGAAPAVPSRGRPAQRGMAPTAARAPRAPARRRSSPPVEGAGKVSLLDRLGVGDGDAGAKRAPEKATPNKTARGGAKKQTAKARRGGLASPHAGNQGGSDANSLFNRITAATKPGDLGSRIS